MATAAVQSHQVRGLSFSPEQLAERRKHLGASEIGAVAGLNSKRTPLDVWAEKRGLVPPFQGNEYTEWGLRLEGAIAQKYVEVVDASDFSKPDSIIHPAHDWKSASPDGIVVVDGVRRGLEIKRFGEHRTEDFGPAGTDQVPMEVAAQAHWSMDVVGLDAWDVAVLLGQADFRIYHLRRDTVIAENLHSIGERFWFEHVVAGVQPDIDGSTASHKFLQQFFKSHSQLLLEPTPDQIRLVELLRQVKRDLKAREAEESHLEAQLKLAIGAAAGIRGLCTWKAPKSGFPRWKEIAQHIAGAAGIPQPLIDSYTNEPTRRFNLLGKDD
jgi:putative phage-type endonuclease